MNAYLILVALISLSAAFAYVNYRFIKLPFVIGLFFLATVLSLVVISSRWWDVYVAFNGVPHGNPDAYFYADDVQK